MKAALLLMVLGVTSVLSADRIQTPSADVNRESELDEECRNMKPLEKCTKDQGPKQPQHLQAVYLGSERGPGWWLYPSAGSWLKQAKHDTRTITDTTDNWAQWIWHDCGYNYVCLESGRYPNYYLYKTRTFGHKIAYAAAPALEDWAKFRIVEQRIDDRGLFMNLVRKRYEARTNRRGLPVYIYIPPRCEGYQQVVNHANKSPVPINHSYMLHRGVTLSETVSRMIGIGIEVGIEIVKEVVQGVLSGSFSISWNHEKTTAFNENQVQELSITIPPGKRLVKWQKVATYGPYMWRSGVDFITCLTDIQPQGRGIDPRIQQDNP